MENSEKPEGRGVKSRQKGYFADKRIDTFAQLWYKTAFV
jgi:hypothetical protein